MVEIEKKVKNKLEVHPKPEELKNFRCNERTHKFCVGELFKVGE